MEYETTEHDSAVGTRVEKRRSFPDFIVLVVYEGGFGTSEGVVVVF
jgi:hypothetical protein